MRKLMKNENFYSLLIVLVSLGSLALFQPSCFAATYHITNVDELQAMQNDLYGDYILDNDIDASETQTWNGGAGFVPVGNGHEFEGSLDGAGYTITGLYINRPSTTSGVGLFGVIDKYANIAISNLMLENVDITGDVKVGALAGEVKRGDITNCSATGNVRGDSKVGGLVGDFATAPYVHDSIYTCYSACSVSGRHNSIGGLIGESEGIITNCYATGSVNGESDDVGGLVGHGSPPGTITNSYATGLVLGGGSKVGGLVGYMSSGEITNCYATGNVDGNKQIGGLVGDASALTTTDSYYTSRNHNSIGIYEPGGPTVFYNSSHSVYNVSPAWDFDNVWTIIEDHTYPFFGPSPFIDIGLRVYDGTEAVKIACEPDDNVTSPLRIAKDEKVYGIALVAIDDPNATKIRIKTSSGVMALRRY